MCLWVATVYVTGWPPNMARVAVLTGNLHHVTESTPMTLLAAVLEVIRDAE